jgi:hypothetical protein
MTTSVESGRAAWRFSATVRGARESLPPYTNNVGILTYGSTLRRSSADARAIARNPAGWNASMLAAKSLTDSRGVTSENMVGRSAPTNSSGDESAS